MIGNEGKTRYTVYDYYTRCGFNPDKHMLMAPIMQPDNYLRSGGWFHGEPDAAPTWRTEYRNQGEVACDWDLMTSVEGLYTAGATSGLEGSGFACSSGFYAGARAAEYAAGHGYAGLLKEDVLRERERVYRPLSIPESHERSVSWKELWVGSARVMQQCCAAVKTQPVLELGLEWLRSIRETELPMLYARNPHELARAIECETRITCSEVFIHACLSRLRAEKNGTGKGKYLFCKLVEDGVRDVVREDKYWLRGDNENTYLKNYLRHTGAEREGKENE